MANIPRAQGTTPSERYLAQLAERSFLDLWSYPNLFIDRRGNGGKSDGKELCDLLVVCGDHVLIFSDKSIAWPSVDDVDLAWSRWFRRAVKKSADQVRGAERWISQHPDRLFLDAACTKRFPIELPPPERRRVHCIVVALGATEACQRHFGKGSGSLQIVPAIKGKCHSDTKCPEYRPLSIGDISPDGTFVHVFDDVTLDIVMQELDTVTDLADYLERKAEFFRSGHLVEADGEEDVLSYYLVRTDPENEHAFINPDGGPWSDGQVLRIVPGTYAAMREHPAYIAKKKADEISYVWDNLIRAFTTNIIGGTLAETPEWASLPQDGKHEMGVRYMALEDRTQRRALGGGIIDALSKGQSNRFARGFVPSPGEREHETGYVFMLLRRPEDPASDYEEYRAVRSSMLYGYAINTLRRHGHLKRVIAIGTEPPAEYTGQAGASEDLIYMEMPQWTDAEIKEAEKFSEHYDIFRDDTLSEFHVHTEEYPHVPANANLSYTNPIPYDFLHPPPTEDEMQAAERRRRARAAFRGKLLSGVT